MRFSFFSQVKDLLHSIYFEITLVGKLLVMRAIEIDFSYNIYVTNSTKSRNLLKNWNSWYLLKITQLEPYNIVYKGFLLWTLKMWIKMEWVSVVPLTKKNRLFLSTVRITWIMVPLFVVTNLLSNLKTWKLCYCSNGIPTLNVLQISVYTEKK